MMYHNRRYRGTIYILRGLPGTGKSGIAWNLWQEEGGEIVSFFDYYRIYHNSQMNTAYFGRAHKWARKTAIDALERGVDPVIINNCNMPRWHMYPYVLMASTRDYWIEFIETEDTWNVPLEELERRCDDIPLSVLDRMKESYEPARNPYDVLLDEYSESRWISNREMTQYNWSNIQ
ncbi:NEDD4-binding protein 2-like 1 [Alosa sapidissima]|uniref:NEDD4-binding protein 2-like 1 n=1 Tax=Alosa sapidissima TaxID=34773 RepID=UPI001C08926C|nr:NEDD4-binding protein 2-like 1 [Alosa sapidissima]